MSSGVGAAGSGNVAIQMDALPPVPAAVPNIPKVEIPSPPCTCRCCGRFSWGLIDSISVVIEIISVIGAAYSAANDEDVTAGLMGGACALSLTGHFLYRKFGDIGHIAEKLQSAQENFQKSIQEQAQLVGQWSGILSQVKQTNQQLQEQNSAFSNSNSQLEETVGKLTDDLEQLKKTNEELTQINTDLKSQVGSLQDVNRDFEAKIQRFKQQIGSFNEAIGNVTHLIPQLHAVDDTLDESVEVLDHRFDENIDEMGNQIVLLQTNLKMALETLQKEKEELEKEVAQLKAESDHFREEVAQFEAEREKFQKLEESVHHLTAELEELRSQAAPQRAALEEEVNEMAPLLASLQRETTALHGAATSLAPLAASFTDLQQSLSTTLEKEQEAQQAIAAQLKELNS